MSLNTLSAYEEKDNSNVFLAFTFVQGASDEKIFDIFHTVKKCVENIVTVMTNCVSLKVVSE